MRRQVFVDFFFREACEVDEVGVMEQFVWKGWFSVLSTGWWWCTDDMGTARAEKADTKEVDEPLMIVTSNPIIAKDRYDGER